MNTTIGTTSDQESIWVDSIQELVHFGKYTMSIEFWRDINELVIAAYHHRHIGNLVANQPQQADGPLTSHYINQAQNA